MNKFTPMIDPRFFQYNTHHRFPDEFAMRGSGFPVVADYVDLLSRMDVAVVFADPQAAGALAELGADVHYDRFYPRCDQRVSAALSAPTGTLTGRLPPGE